jgi:hypothetical protein
MKSRHLVRKIIAMSLVAAQLLFVLNDFAFFEAQSKRAFSAKVAKLKVDTTASEALDGEEDKSDFAPHDLLNDNYRFFLSSGFDKRNKAFALLSQELPCQRALYLQNRTLLI